MLFLLAQSRTWLQRYSAGVDASNAGINREQHHDGSPLDQLLENQLLIAKSIGVLQQSIDELQRNMPCFISLESGLVLQEQCAALHWDHSIEGRRALYRSAWTSTCPAAGFDRTHPHSGLGFD